MTKQTPIDFSLEGGYQMNIKITSQMADSSGLMRIGDMARQMQIAIENHFDMVSGITGDQLHAMGKTLVIGWTQISISRRPAVGEEVVLRCWPGKDKMMMMCGKFDMTTMDGEPLMATTSLFLLMDLVSRTMTERPEEMKHLDPVIVLGELQYPKMTLPFPGEFRNQFKRVVTSDEIDYNGHLNNTRYLDWAEELVDEQYVSEHPPKSVWVQYMKEMQEGDQALLQYDWQENSLYLRGTCNGDDTFLLVMKF